MFETVLLVPLRHGTVARQQTHIGPQITQGELDAQLLRNVGRSNFMLWWIIGAYVAMTRYAEKKWRTLGKRWRSCNYNKYQRAHNTNSLKLNEIYYQKVYNK